MELNITLHQIDVLLDMFTCFERRVSIVCSLPSLTNSGISTEALVRTGR